ncbi:UNKNOWN [Stylonychia lemnae]|uniref:Uncharacterized protein n=1 Tax=Stylonychia lemnae TaxID=5949 RepID=A0A078AVA0_STYLE|nr:UNKNOWN [Stylonychia lemnae]|eukprot:CDW85941.1 UNKNOWN [Stylonychia lemnae]
MPSSFNQKQIIPPQSTNQTQNMGDSLKFDTNLMLQKQVYLLNRTHNMSYNDSNNQTGDVCTSSMQGSDVQYNKDRLSRFKAQKKVAVQEYSKIDYTRSSQLNSRVSYENDSSIANQSLMQKKINAQLNQSNQATKPKDFCSKRNPLKLKRKEQKQQGFVWFATYNNLIFEDELRIILQRPEFSKESNFPQVITLQIQYLQEMASIHIKDYDMHFGTYTEASQEVYPFLLNLQNSIAFLKVYLLTYTQFQLLVQYLTKCHEHFILYYLYKRNQVRGNFTMKDLVQIAIPELSELVQQVQKLPQNQKNEEGGYNNLITSEERNQSNTTQDVDQTLRCTTCIIDSSFEHNHSEGHQHHHHQDRTHHYGGHSARERPYSQLRNQINPSSLKSNNTYNTDQSRIIQERKIINLFDIPDFNEKTGEARWKNGQEVNEHLVRQTFSEHTRGGMDLQQSVHTSLSLVSGRGFAFGGKILNGFGMGGENLQTELSDISGQNGFFNQSFVMNLVGQQNNAMNSLR